jgi:hypothetical protein
MRGDVNPIDLSNYVEVNERITEFRERFPEGSLQSTVLHFPDADLPFLVVEARAFRTPSDPRPGIGLAWEPFPGQTPYTRNSELQNAETSAWGRALVAVGAADARRGIATREDVAARSGETLAGASQPEGERSPRTSTSTPSGFPVDPKNCSHRFPSGAWLKWTSTDQCPKCGTPKVTAMESTTADLGAP